MEIIIFKLVSGESVVGQVENKSKTTFKLKYPTEVISKYSTDTSRHQLLLVRWQPYSDEEYYDIKRIHIIGQSVVSPEVEKYYLNKIKEIYDIPLTKTEEMQFYLDHMMSNVENDDE